MAKIKVHELAKELGADKGEIVAYLRAKGYAAMTGVTAVPEGEVENVRSRFGGGKSRTAAREQADAKTGRAEGQEAPKKSKVVVLGLTFKENCPDCRNSKVADILDRMREFGIEPEVVDPWADPEVAKREYNVELKDLNEVHGADCVIVAVAHREFRKLGLAGIERLYREDAKRVLLDVKGIYQIKDLEDASFVWWRL